MVGGDRAVDLGQLALFEGKVTFEADDLRRLQHLLDVNMPMDAVTSYEVKE